MIVQTERVRISIWHFPLRKFRKLFISVIFETLSSYLYSRFGESDLHGQFFPTINEKRNLSYIIINVQFDFSNIHNIQKNFLWVITLNFARWHVLICGERKSWMWNLIIFASLDSRSLDQCMTLAADTGLCNSIVVLVANSQASFRTGSFNFTFNPHCVSITLPYIKPVTWFAWHPPLRVLSPLDSS